ncbi:FRG1-like family-domain-containing protein [Echria macrotheca]|uniref:FRG1-like family-domain-containing protein n=1 Tax=Echria macrotheca TaxID=438768 RepID=A0AAJ0BFK7_9PEZI|nr:FRG1-like family-domain-containing protein [Echria macrotheca]
MVKPLTFKGDKKPKKRKRATAAAEADPADAPSPADNDNDTDNAAPASRRLKAAKASNEEDQEDPASDDSWVSADAVTDISGPIMFVLPSDPPSALACDANGKVFSLPVENIVENNPSTAEPHDVRQVWVANRIVGTEHFRFKGHHGRYLSSDKFGMLTATSEAVSPLESFVVTATADTPGTFQIQTLRDTYLTIKEVTPTTKKGCEVRADAEDVSFDTTLRIRMQARFKPRLKASREEKAREKISRRELEEAVGRRLDEDEVKRLKRARREGDYHEVLLDIKVKSKHDKYS